MKKLENSYDRSLKMITDRISKLQFDIGRLKAEYDWLNDDDPEKEKVRSQIQSKIYQKGFQQALQGQIDDILNKLHTQNYTAVSEYLNGCYEDGYIGAMYDLHGQGIPLIMPIDQKAVVRAVRLDSKLSKPLYTRLGEDIGKLKQTITAELSRGIATGMSYGQVAQQIKLKMTGTYNTKGGAYGRALTIARTEGHRIQVQGGMDACNDAKSKGADVVKQWDSTLDGITRPSHRLVDGEIRELDEAFSNGLMFPGDPSGKAAEVVNCRCALLQRARWALDEDELEALKERAEFFGLDKTENFEDFKKKYLVCSESLDKSAKSDIIESEGDRKMNLIIDKFTPCLENTETGELMPTVYERASRNDLLQLKGWNFNWLDKELEYTEIYKLCVAGDKKIQGLVAVTDFKRDMAVYVNIAESAPHNLGKNKKFNGVGGHLFAIAAKISLEKGYGGFLFMDAKNTDLVKHYSKTLNAVLLGRPHPYRMFIDEENAMKLLDTYTFEEG